MFPTEVPLATLYHRLVENSEYHLLILALIRDADAPGFYLDVERYWSSLDDVTGQSALFVLAAENVAAHRHEWSIVDGVYSPDVCVPGKAVPFGEDEERMALGPYARTSWNRAWNIRDANTSQVSELRHALGISESDVPCLHLTLMNSPSHRLLLRLRNIPDFSIYTLCKDIMIRLEPLFRGLQKPSEPSVEAKEMFMQRRTDSVAFTLKQYDAVRAKAAEKYHQKLEISEKEKQRAGHILRDGATRLASVRALARTPGPSRRNELIESLLARSTDHNRKAKWENPVRQRVMAATRSGLITREEAQLLNELIESQFEQFRVADLPAEEAELIAARQRMVRAEAEYDEQFHTVNSELERRRSEWERDYEQLRNKYERDLAAYGPKVEEYSRRMSQLEAAFQSLSALETARRTDRTWDYFISYPQHARELASDIFRRLDGIVRVFMDFFCLVVGQHWDQVIPEIQTCCRGTIVIVTTETRQAHFQQSEIHRAINLHRTAGHKIVPVYPNPTVQAPFGLEQIHGVVRSSNDADDLPTLLIDQLRRDDDLVASGLREPRGRDVARALKRRDLNRALIEQFQRNEEDKALPNKRKRWWWLGG